MNNAELVDRAAQYLSTLCNLKPNRRTGSPGNREATRFFAGLVEKLGYETDTTAFKCLDWIKGEASLSSDGSDHKLHISPYSLGCDVTAELVAVSSLEELEHSHCGGRILLMTGEICAEQLMPKNFVFYNPEHHQRIYTLLEKKKPAAIITATAKNPELVGALYPFPLIADGDFDIPSAYCTDVVGWKIADRQGQAFSLRLEAERVPASATNVVAQKNPQAERKVVITSHIDAYEDTPGASDNASGTVVALLAAELLAGYQGKLGIEIVAVNGEDHYSAAGEMDYLRRYDHTFDRIVVAINVDDVGFVKGRTAYSFYECSDNLQRTTAAAFQDFPGITKGESWFNGDHMIFVQKGLPAIAFTSEQMPELMRTVTHTAADTPELIDCGKLVELAQALERLVQQMPY